MQSKKRKSSFQLKVQMKGNFISFHFVCRMSSSFFFISNIKFVVIIPNLFNFANFVVHLSGYEFVAEKFFLERSVMCEHKRNKLSS